MTTRRDVLTGGAATAAVAALPATIGMAAPAAAAASSGAAAACGEPSGEPAIIRELRDLLAKNPDLKAALEQSVKKANLKGHESLKDFYDYAIKLASTPPRADTLLENIKTFYYLVDQSETLRKSDTFQKWVVDFADRWGEYLDTLDSARHIESFREDPSFPMEDYQEAPSGWLTFNQFFAREVKPGKRPVTGLADDTTVVQPADSVFKGVWPIHDGATVTAKGMTHNVKELLGDSPYRDVFDGGVFTHSFLDVNDYHRYHTPVAGRVLDKRILEGRMVLDVVKKADGSLEAKDGTGYQFRQQRGLIVLDSPVGYVAVLPIGMAQVSSVNLTPDVGDHLHKGQEFGYFLFGGSDIITLFQADAVYLEATEGRHYKQGKWIGRAKST